MTAMDETRAPFESMLASFRQVYESKDGRLAAYADADGRWTCVNTEKLASSPVAEGHKGDIGAERNV